jgi:hypothetical protein
VANVALFLVLDRSASMDIGRRNEPTKLAMAKEAASQAIGLLHPNDIVGVVAFDTDFEWVIPTTRIRNADDIKSAQARVGAIQSGGGTSILGPLKAAYDAIDRTDARLKHIVLLTDGQSSDKGYEELIQQMRPAHITLSTVAIGADADTKLLQVLANLGDGRYYFTERSTQIPVIASKETSILTRNAVIEGPVSALVRDPSPVVRGLSGDFPSLQGYVATTPRDRAVLALETDKGDPLLAHWQYGLGRVVAWMSDASPGGWAASWMPAGWSEAGDFWPQIVRWSMPAPRTPGFDVTARLDPSLRQVVLHVDSERSDGTFADLQDTRATIVPPDGSAREVTLLQSGPGTYERTLNVDQAGVYRVLVSQRDGDAVTHEETVGFAVPSVGPELRTVGSNLALLDQLAQTTGGRVLTDPADVARSFETLNAEHRVPIWPWLIGLAALLIPLDVAARRLRWPGFDRW